MKVAAFFFDLDGTLVYTLPDIAASVNAALKEQAEKVNVTYSGNVSIQTLAKDYQMAGLSGITYSLAAATVSAKTTGAVGAFWYVNNVSYPAVVEFQNKYADLPYDSPLTYGRDWYMDENGRKMGVRLYDPYDYMVKDASFSQNHALSATISA